MEQSAAASANGEPGPYPDAIVGKPARIRRAQQDGLLDAAWDPIDIMALLSATSARIRADIPNPARADPPWHRPSRSSPAPRA
ncbi:hypothetical protein ACQEVF_46310 [Nonomuraea polychroma]|uniref:hypothetical protein n=1 Tax=Nonomuraea polychroma TaxID=46176 RepID=UPI003D8ADC1C